jgi:hypothetical protein
MRKWLFVGLAVALVLFGVLLPLLLPWHCPVNRAAFERIEKGMTRAQVEAILGGPCGNYRTRPFPKNQSWVLPSSGPILFYQSWEPWAGDEVVVHVCFDDEGIVELKVIGEESPPDTGLVELASWRLKRLKGRWFP